MAQAGALTLLRGRWKYIEPSKGPRLSANTNTELGNDPGPQLFDLVEDGGERRNLAASAPDEVRALADLLRQVRAGQLRPRQ